jgi:circadian clock protein KaiC
MITDGMLELIYLRPLDLSVDETLAEILDATERVGATRVVIDSLSGFQIALAPTFREDFKESLYRLVGALTATGVTVFMTSETTGGYPDVHFTTEKVSFITDDIIVQRFVEIDGTLRRVLAVHKMRGSAHSADFRTYDITAAGAVVGGPLRNYQGILTGVPELQKRLAGTGYAGLATREAAVLETLVRLGEVSREELATRVGMTPLEVEQALDRLEALGYAIVSGDDDSTYRAVAQPGG